MKYHKYKYSLLFFGYNCFTKAQVLANPHGSIPNSHKREAEEKAESAANLGDHCRLLVKKFLSLHRGVPCLSKKREDEVVWRIWELERGGDWSPLELVLQVVARFSAAGHTPDYLQLFILQLKVDPLKLPATEADLLIILLDFQSAKKGHVSPVLLKLCADWDGLVGPSVPTWSTTNLTSQTFFHAKQKVVIFIFYARILRNVLLEMLSGWHLVIDFVSVWCIRCYLYINWGQRTTVVV